MGLGNSSSLLRIELFPGGGGLPIWVGKEKGWFAANGLDVAMTFTPGSVHQLSNLIEGNCDLALTLIDNVVAYREGQGEIPITGPDLIAVMTVDTDSMPTLVTIPEIRTYGDLRGRTLSLDALTTGYAFVLRAMLENGGLAVGDYKFESVGGAMQRFEALQKRKHAAALFNSPFEAMLVEKGFNALETARSAIGRYQGMSIAARGAWAQSNRGSVVRFCRIVSDAIDWIYDPGNREEATVILGRYVKDSPKAIEAAYALLTDPEQGLRRKGFVDVEGIRRVLAMRSRYGVPEKVLDDPYRYYDPSYLTEALAD